MRKIINIRNSICFFITLFILYPVYSAELNEISVWPKLDGDKTRSECIEAFSLAKSIFKSNEKTVYNPSVKNISLQDESVFEQIDGDKPGSSEDSPTHWQRKQDHGARFVIKEDNYAWRGNQFALYIIDAKISSKEFLANPGKPVVDETWNEQIIMQNKTGNLWAIDVGQPFIPLSDWTIYAAENGKSLQLCKIHFRKEIKTSIELLPKPVRQLEKMLDESIGIGNDGTLNTQGRLRVSVSHAWANIALRPWVVAYDHYRDSFEDAKKSVDLKLKQWSTKAVSFKKLYNKINEQYPKAEKALANYYEHVFNMTPEKAKEMAHYGLIDAYTNHYLF